MTVRRAVLPAILLAVLATSRAEAIPCPGNGAKLKIVINNPTTSTGQQIFLSGSMVDGQATCIGQADTYATTVTLTSLGDNTFTIPVSGGLNTGVWMHHISAGDQFQHRRTPVLFTSDPMKYATVRWTYYPTVIQVNKVGDAAGSCTGSDCTLRQAIDWATTISSTTPAILIQLMLSPSNMTQVGDIVVGSAFGSAPLITIDGTDASGNPWIVGDALAAAQGSQSPFSRAINLRNTTKLRIAGENVTVRGVAILNTVTSGSPSDDLVEINGANARIEAVRLDGGATGACVNCVLADRNLIRVAAGGPAEVVNVEGRAAYTNGVRVDFSSGISEIRDSWFHHNYATGILPDGVFLERNMIELTGRKLTNVVVNSDGVGVREHASGEISTMANVIRNNSSFGLTAIAAVNDLEFAHDAVCGNGNTGMSVEVGPQPFQALGTGLGTVYNSEHGVEFVGPSALANSIQFNDDSAFTANDSCGFSNTTAISASALNNQWRGAVTTCTQSPDVCTGGGPIDCDPFQDRVNVAIALDAEPTYPRNAMVKGQTLRVQGSGFNAIDGNPEAGTGPGQFDCELGSDDVSSANCCRNTSKANVCDTSVSPPDPPSTDGSNCVAILDATNQWKALSVTSITPTRIVTEVPDPALLCVGEGFAQSVRVVKQGSGGPIQMTRNYCRNTNLP